MQVVLAEGLEIRQPLIAAIDGLRDCRLSRKDGVALLQGQSDALAQLWGLSGRNADGRTRKRFESARTWFLVSDRVPFRTAESPMYLESPDGRDFLWAGRAHLSVCTGIVHFPFLCRCGADFPLGGTLVAMAGFFGGGL